MKRFIAALVLLLSGSLALAGLVPSGFNPTFGGGPPIVPPFAGATPVSQLYFDTGVTPYQGYAYNRTLSAWFAFGSGSTPCDTFPLSLQFDNSGVFGCASTANWNATRSSVVFSVDAFELLGSSNGDVAAYHTNAGGTVSLYDPGVTLASLQVCTSFPLVVQFNNNGVFGCASTVAWNATRSHLVFSTDAFELAGTTNGDIAAYHTNAGGTVSIYDPGVSVALLQSGAATAQSQPGNPTAPGSTAAFAMAGLAGSVTPAKSGKLLIEIAGFIQDTSNLVANVGITYQISYGTGTAPSNGAALQGTQAGAAQTYTAPVAPTAAVDVNIPFSTQVVVTGLTVGTAYWIDLAQKSVTTVSQYKFANISISVIEL